MATVRHRAVALTDSSWQQSAGASSVATQPTLCKKTPILQQERLPVLVPNYKKAGEVKRPFIRVSRPHLAVTKIALLISGRKQYLWRKAKAQAVCFHAERVGLPAIRLFFWRGGYSKNPFRVYTGRACSRIGICVLFKQLHENPSSAPGPSHLSRHAAQS